MSKAALQFKNVTRKYISLRYYDSMVVRSITRSLMCPWTGQSTADKETTTGLTSSKVTLSTVCRVFLQQA